MTHRGYFGIMQHAYLAGYAAATEDVRKKSTDLPIGPFLSVDRMFFVSAFQGGIDRFLTPVRTDHAEGLEFLKSRFSSPKQRDIDVSMQISKVFKTFRRNQAEDYDNIHVEAFVADLICAMRNSASMLSVMPMPDSMELSRAFVPELAMPLIQLVSSFQPYSETTPVPRWSISTDGLRRFQEIIESGAFERYSRQHLTLQEENSKVSSILNRIQKAGTSLLEKGNQLLVPQSSLLHLLRIVPKMVDAVFGRLPGSLAQLAGDAAERHVSDRKRVVVYHYDKWIAAYTAMQMGHRVRSGEGRKASTKRTAVKAVRKGDKKS